MKSILAFLMVFLPFTAITQTDTIFMMTGEILPVVISEVGESSVKFIYPGEEIPNSISKASIRKIHFKSGRVQNFSFTSNLSIIKSGLDWEKVQVSNIESEVAGLFKIDDVSSKAQGSTTMSSLGKIQSRAFNKLKMITAMLGGNLVYIIHQSSEGAVSGRGYGSSSKAANTVISGIGYTSKKVFIEEIVPGNYVISAVYSIGPNDYEIDKALNFDATKVVKINHDNILDQNGFFIVRDNFKYINEVDEFSIIYADNQELILSGFSTSKKGKEYYYNIFLNRKN
jgi:hypothetical protein